MQLFRRDPSQNLGRLIDFAIILCVLLIILSVFALVGNVLGLMARFRTAIYLFVFGAILAYLMAGPVGLLQRVVRKRWVAMVGAYLLLFAALIGFAFVLVNPFITQATSLVQNLRNPAVSSLSSLQTVQRDATRVQSDLSAQQHLVAGGQSPPQSAINQARTDIAALTKHLAELQLSTGQHGSIQIPPSYVGPIETSVTALQSDYMRAVPSPTSINVSLLSRAVADANAMSSQANAVYKKSASTPLLFLAIQTWLDSRHISVDLYDRIRQSISQLQSQVSSILNNALNITLQAGNLLLDTVLVVLISIYFVADGARFIRWLIRQVPTRSRPLVTLAVANLDQILGTYIRTQIVLALLAGTLDATGAAVLGVPYAIVIFFSSFFLSLVPVIGPIILPVPPMLIALVFTPLPTPFFYLPWLLIGEQFVTNVIGPRLQAQNLRIHPLEATAAALIGLPLAGIAGAFFAVPIVAFVHIVVREFLQAHRTGGNVPATPNATEQGQDLSPTGTVIPRRK